jgi:hypothetical protein
MGEAYPMTPEDLIPDSFEISWELAAFAKAVIQTFAERFDYLSESNIGFLLTNLEIKKHGKLKAAYAMIPNARGEEGKLWYWAMTRLLGFTPDALLVADKVQWEEMPKEARVVLVYHELYHLEHKVSSTGAECYDADTRRPVLTMRGHDCEEFFEVAEKFGAWSGTTDLFVKLVREKEGKFKDLPGVVKLAESFLAEQEVA